MTPILNAMKLRYNQDVEVMLEQWQVKCKGDHEQRSIEMGSSRRRRMVSMQATLDEM